MPKFISASRLKQAVERLGNSSAHQRFADFLVLKRALRRIELEKSVKRKGAVVLSLNNRDFTGAIDDVMAWSTGASDEATDLEFPYINVFGTALHEDLGYRSDKFPSNGTAVTVASPPWRRVTDLLDERPRAIQFKQGYVSLLGSFFLTKDGDRPKLIDAALWYFRGQDISAHVGKKANDTARHLVAPFVDACGLTRDEIGRLFDPAVEEGNEWLSEAKPQPAEYLPQRKNQKAIQTTVPAGDGGTGTPACSLDLVVALAAKNFVLLTGPSGTGKTRVALELAEALETVANEGAGGASLSLIPVGADWTDARPLLGYRNPFGKQRNTATGQETNETYEIPDALHLLLRAADPDRATTPHFLILDEMNLSHVERYFSAFLSLMEAKRSVTDPSRVPLLSRETVALIAEVLESERPSSLDAEAARKIDQNGRGLILPPGLLVIGTVNVDETTYMFSPKVLDRAHVLELLPPTPSAYVNGTVAIAESIPAARALEVLKTALDLHRQGFFDDKTPKGIMEEAVKRFDVSQTLADSILQQTTRLLDGAFKLLDPVGFGFAYRVVNEVFTYL